MKKFGRRTVLQLNEKKSEKKPEKPIGFGGLVQYGNDNSDSEEEEEETTVTPTVMPASPVEQNGQADQPSSSVKNGPDMDTQLADFLAEIESISKDEGDSEEAEGTTTHVETAAADSTSTTPHTSKQITPAVSSEESESEEEEEPAPDVTKPTEPSTSWQHCLDEGTQHYYYWNTATNEVTWEIPEDYSKYLLLLKEYEERLAKYETTMKEWEERKKEPRKKKTKKKTVTNGAADSSAVDNIEPRPLVDYKSETPEIKANVELVTNKYGRGLGFSAEEGDITPYAPRHRATYPVNFVKGETVTNKLPELIPKVSKVEPSSNLSRNSSSNSINKADRLSPAPSFPPQAVDKSKESDKSDSDADNDDQDDTVQGAQLPTFSAPVAESVQPSCNGKQRETSVESKSDSDMELEDFDVDDIDRQLELALEKKLDGKPKQKRRLENEVDKNDGKKKKRTREGSPPIRPLQPRPPALPPDDKVEKKKIIEEDIKLRAEVAELARDISDKLDFLEITRKSMSQLQILLIETETRISDWREGGMESGFMLKKLQDAGKQLKRYESSAAPPGWSCHWDRTYKRYYYFHNTTGESSWEYPEDEAKDNVTSSQVPAPPNQQPGHPVVHSAVQGPPPTNAATLNRDQPIHFAGLTAAPPPPPSHPAPSGPSLHPAPYPDTTVPAPTAYFEAPLKLPPGITNPPPPPSTSPPPPPPGTTPPLDGSPADIDMQDAQNEAAKAEEADDGNVISAAPQIRQNIDLNDAQSLDGVPMADTADVDAEDLPTHSAAPPAQPPASQPSTSSLPELSSSAVGTGKEKKKKKKLGTGLAMKKKGVGNLVQKWQQIQEEVATKQKD